MVPGRAVQLQTLPRYNELRIAEAPSDARSLMRLLVWNGSNLSKRP